jgi:PadR family transcriptional regulator PadR
VPPSKKDPQLLKGVLPMLILAELAKAPTYGYDLVQGTVYPLLTRLEREGLLTFELVPSHSGPARKNYAISPTGEQELHAIHSAWQALNTVVNRIMETDDE